MWIMFHLLVLVLVLCTTLSAQGCPNIVSRAQWGSQYSCTKRLDTPVWTVIIHHTAGAFCNSRTSCSSQVRNIQNFHKKTNGWCDIGYNFLIGEDGNIYEGQGWTKQGIHAKSNNFGSIGISFMGNFVDRAPNFAALNAARQLIACGVSRKVIRENYVLKGHKDVNPTACPGSALYNVIRKWPRFNPKG